MHRQTELIPINNPMSNKIPLSKVQVQLIEELVQVHVMMGLQPAWGKILALLTVSDETELTFEQIMETLDISKSGVSQALKQLELTKRIAYRTKMNDRKRYFHLRIEDWREQVAEMFSVLGKSVATTNKILKIRPAATKAFNRDLADMNNFLSSLHKMTIPALKTTPDKK